MRIAYKLILGFIVVAFLSMIAGYMAISASEKLIRETFIEETESLGIELMDLLQRELHHYMVMLQDFS
jgi:hypothetical protein